MSQTKENDMTDILAQAGKPADRAVMVTLCGDSGMGKTSLAATFPKPIFIRAEDGMQAIPASKRPNALPLIASVEQLWEQLNALIHEEHDYQTVVIDSVTALERLPSLSIRRWADTAQAQTPLQRCTGGFARLAD
jgi:KaiC/GvpD/RAD55 family RecA-like ATPase